MKRKAPRCSKCGYTGHNARTCPKPKKASSPKRKQRCSYCADLDHRGTIDRVTGRALHCKSPFLTASYEPLEEMYNHRKDSCPLRASEVVLQSDLKATDKCISTIEALFATGLGPGALIDHRAFGLGMISRIDWGFEGREIEPLTVKNVNKLRGTTVPRLFFRALKSGTEEGLVLEWFRGNTILGKSSNPFEIPEEYRDPTLPHHLVTSSSLYVS